MKKIPRIIFKDNTMFKKIHHSNTGWSISVLYCSDNEQVNILFSPSLQHVEKQLKKLGYRLPSEVEKLFYAKT